MVNQISKTEAALIARAGYETGQIGFFEYTIPSMFMPNGGIHVVGDVGGIWLPAKYGGQQVKYLVAYRNGEWIGFDLTVIGQSQTEYEVYADAVAEALKESVDVTGKLFAYGALAIGAYWLYTVFKK